MISIFLRKGGRGREREEEAQGEGLNSQNMVEKERRTLPRYFRGYCQSVELPQTVIVRASTYISTMPHHLPHLTIRSIVPTSWEVSLVDEMKLFEKTAYIMAWKATATLIHTGFYAGNTVPKLRLHFAFHCYNFHYLGLLALNNSVQNGKFLMEREIQGELQSSPFPSSYS